MSNKIKCLGCDGWGHFYRKEIQTNWPCHVCAGKGWVPLKVKRDFIPHPERNDRSYVPRKGVA